MLKFFFIFFFVIPPMIGSCIFKCFLCLGKTKLGSQHCGGESALWGGKGQHRKGIKRLVSTWLYCGK